jgi:4'-phosphopantetheinyl transferase
MLDIWHISLDQNITLLPQVLDKDEQARGEKFHFEHHRRQFMVSHIVTRLILASYCSIDPAKLVFKYNSYGKPFLVHHDKLLFNISHTDEMALCVVSDGVELGIDIEKKRPINCLEMAERFFSTIEYKLLTNLMLSQQQDGFFNCWTRKEAYIKAKGLGLSIPLDQFSMTLTPDGPVALLSSKFAKDDVERFCIMDIKVQDGYKAALAYVGLMKEEPVNYQWQPDQSM